MTSPIVVNLPGVKLLSSSGSGANGRQHHHAKSRETRSNREGANLNVAKALMDSGHSIVPDGRYKSGAIMFVANVSFAARRVTMTRVCPRRYFCDGADNLRSLFKATLDGVADALGVNDKVFADNPTESDIQSGKIGITYKQIDGPWGLRIEIEPA